MNTPEVYCYDFVKKDFGWYHAESSHDLDYGIPKRLRLEQPVRSDYARRCKYILSGPDDLGKRVFFTGLMSTCEKTFVYGDVRRRVNGSGVKSLVIADVSQPEHLTLIYYPNLWIQDISEREDFVCDQIDRYLYGLVNE